MQTVRTSCTSGWSASGRPSFGRRQILLGDVRPVRLPGPVRDRRPVPGLRLRRSRRCPDRCRSIRFGGIGSSVPIGSKTPAAIQLRSSVHRAVFPSLCTLVTRIGSGPDHEHRPREDRISWHRVEIAGVLRVGAVVADHEVLVGSRPNPLHLRVMIQLPAGRRGPRPRLSETPRITQVPAASTGAVEVSSDGVRLRDPRERDRLGQRARSWSLPRTSATNALSAPQAAWLPSTPAVRSASRSLLTRLTRSPTRVGAPDLFG